MVRDKLVLIILLLVGGLLLGSWLVEIRRFNKQLEVGANELDYINQVIADHQQQLEKTDINSFSPPEGSRGFINYLEELVVDYDLELESLIPEQRSEKRHKVSIIFRGSYKQIVNFLEQLKDRSELIKVELLQLKAVKDENFELLDKAPLELIKILKKGIKN